MIQWLYVAFIRPMISYGALVWATNILDTKATVLRRIQWPMLARCGLIRCNTPTRSLEIILDVKPLLLHLKETALATAVRYH